MPQAKLRCTERNINRFEEPLAECFKFDATFMIAFEKS